MIEKKKILVNKVIQILEHYKVEMKQIGNY